MQISAPYYSFIFKHTFHTCKFLGMDKSSTIAVIKATIDILAREDPNSKPPEVVCQIQEVVRHITKNPDPYKDAKEKSTKNALELYPYLKKLVAESQHPFDTAVRIAIAGNIIDFGLPVVFDLKDTIRRVLDQPFAVNHLSDLQAVINRSTNILFISDNAGETVFDRILIEYMDKPVIYAVKAGPIINDATFEDALSAGIDKIAKILSCGAQTPGTVLRLCSDEFLNYFDNVDLIISKGQANYIMLDGLDARIFHLLQIKSQYLEYISGFPIKSILVKRSAENDTH